MGHARNRSPTENHLRRDAGIRHSRSPDLLRRLQVQPFDPDERRSLAGPFPAFRYRAVVRLQGLRQARCRGPGTLRARQDGHGLVKYAADRPFADPEKAARKLVEIANSIEAVQDGRIHVEKINWPFLFEFKGSPADYGVGLKLAIDRGWSLISCGHNLTRAARLA